MLSPEGSFFREFLLDEAVKGIDALSRDNAATVLARFGLGDARVPLFLPGSLAPTQVRVSPNVTAEDKATVESVTKLLNFLLRGSRGGDESGAKDGQASIGADPARAIRELGPLLPAVATERAPRARAPAQLAHRGEDHPRGVRGRGGCAGAGAGGEPVGETRRVPLVTARQTQKFLFHTLVTFRVQKFTRSIAKPGHHFRVRVEKISDCLPVTISLNVFSRELSFAVSRCLLRSVNVSGTGIAPLGIGSCALSVEGTCPRRNAPPGKT